MSGVVVPFVPRRSRTDLVEMTSPGVLHDGLPFYVLELVEPDGTRTSIWDGTDLNAARGAARDCAADGLQVVDRVGGWL